jgi:hypothetical protein
MKMDLSSLGYLLLQGILVMSRQMDDMDELNNNYLFNQCRKLYRRNPTDQEETDFHDLFWKIVVEEGLSPDPARHKAFLKVIT